MPHHWPSPHHNKCSKSDCVYPNPPQAVAGRYSCNGKARGAHCEGYYDVSRKRASAVDHYFQAKFAAEAEAQRKAEQQRRQDKQDAQMEQSKARSHRAQLKLSQERDEEARRQAAAELHARYEAERMMKEARRGHGSPEPQRHHLERRAAQRKRHGEPQSPPPSRAIHFTQALPPQVQVAPLRIAPKPYQSRRPEYPAALSAYPAYQQPRPGW